MGLGVCVGSAIDGVSRDMGCLPRLHGILPLGALVRVAIMMVGDDPLVVVVRQHGLPVAEGHPVKLRLLLYGRLARDSHRLSITTENLLTRRDGTHCGVSGRSRQNS